MNFNELNLKLRNRKNDQLHAHQVIYHPNQPKKVNLLQLLFQKKYIKAILMAQNSATKVNTKADKVKS